MSAPLPAAGSGPAPRPAPHWRGMTFSRDRLVVVGVLVVLLVLGIVLPYVTVRHLNGAAELVVDRQPLFGASALLGGLDTSFLPGYDPALTDRYNVALNVAAAAPGLQEIGTIAALATCWGLFFDEISKFLWWPLHLSGYLLVVVPIPLFVGLHLMRASGISATAWVGWVPALLAGVLVLWATFRSRDRIDTYGGY